MATVTPNYSTPVDPPLESVTIMLTPDEAMQLTVLLGGQSDALYDLFHDLNKVTPYPRAYRYDRDSYSIVAK